jgi:valyl-tRNA synthetase
MSEKPRYEKMSKSKGNVVLPEEVVYGVCDLRPGLEFRDADGQAIDWKKLGVWQDELNTKFFFTATRFGRKPVFLHYKDNHVPALLTLGLFLKSSG